MYSEEQGISIAYPEHNPPAKAYDELLAEYRERAAKDTSPKRSSLITFTGLPVGRDAYNPSGPFEWEGVTYQWARVESREAQDAMSVLFRKVSEGTYEPVEDVSPLPFEDPFTAKIEDVLIVGGVEISKDEHERVIGYRTVFYKGISLHELVPFTNGPEGMKDIRFAELPAIAGTKKILVFTRPYLPVHGRMVGRIGMTLIDSIDELNADRLAVAFTEILPCLFADAEWGGVNDVYAFKNGLVGVLCHIAKFDIRNKRHYAAAAFVIDPLAGNVSALEIIAERGDLPMGPIKIMPENLGNPDMYDDLADVVFSSRLVSPTGDMLHAQTLELTCGLSDAAVGTVTIPNPFIRLVHEYFPDFETTFSE